MKSQTIYSALATVMMLFIAVGCQQPKIMDNPLAVPAGDFAAIWELSRQALYNYGFQLDRRDRRGGVISTYPALAAHAGEYWYDNARGSYNLAESTLHRIYKTATLTITTTAERDYNVAVRVDSRRLSIEKPALTTAGDVRGSIARRRTVYTAERYAGGEVEAPVFIDLGRDTLLEDAILRQISDGLTKQRGEIASVEVDEG